MIHLTLTGLLAGQVLCDAPRHTCGKYIHAMWAPLQREDYRRLVCIRCLQIWDDAAPSQKTEH